MSLPPFFVPGYVHVYVPGYMCFCVWLTCMFSFPRLPQGTNRSGHTLSVLKYSLHGTVTGEDKTEGV